MNIPHSRYRRAELDAHHARMLARIALETGEPITPTPPAGSPAGDERQLRGIPCIARGVGGTSPGTRPDRIAT